MAPSISRVTHICNIYLQLLLKLYAILIFTRQRNAHIILILYEQDTHPEGRGTGKGEFV